MESSTGEKKKNWERLINIEQSHNKTLPLKWDSKLKNTIILKCYNVKMYILFNMYTY